MNKVESSRLVFNYHYKQHAKTSLVYIVTKKGLENFLEELLAAEAEVENNMVELYQATA